MFPDQNTKQILSTAGKRAYQNTIAYSKNIDLSEDGVIKLSAPLCRVYDSGDDANFTLPLDVFSYATGSYKVVTDDNAFNFAMQSLSVTEDSGLTGFRDNTRVCQWVSGNWFLNATSAVYSYDGTTATTNYVSRIGVALDYIEPFVSRNTLVGKFGDNVLRQYDASYNADTHLTSIPANYVITGAAYSNGLMGVVTRQGKNRGKAAFFTWDGVTTSANDVYQIDDPYILDIVAYRTSWAILTSGGELLGFNGGGFVQLGTLPIFDLEAQLISLGPSNATAFGKLLDVDGDRIYVNAASLAEVSRNRKGWNPYFVSGVYCYDPRHGLYHTASPSYSEYTDESATASSNVLTFSSSHYLETGDRLFASSTTNEVIDKTTYYAIKLTSTTIKIAETYQEALDDTAFSVTDGSGYSFLFVKRFDYGLEALRLQDCGTVRKEKEFTGYINTGALPFFVGSRVPPNDLSAAKVTVLDLAVPVMSNRGWFILGKYQTPNLQDNWQGVAVKYSKLAPDDTIVVKAKTSEREPIIIGDNTLFSATYSGESITWDANGVYFETTSDLAEAKEGDEVHIFAGAGAGQSVHIKTIEETGGVYQVTVDEVVRGITSNATSCVVIDRFKKLGTITANDLGGVKKCSLPAIGPSMEVKIEMRGIDVKVYEVVPIRATHKAAL